METVVCVGIKTYLTLVTRNIRKVLVMTIKYNDEQIEKAVDNLIDSWDIDTLVNFAYDDRLHYFLHSADQEEIKMLVQDFGSEEYNNDIQG